MQKNIIFTRNISGKVCIQITFILICFQIFLKILLLDLILCRVRPKTNGGIYFFLVISSSICLGMGWFYSRNICESLCAEDFRYFITQYGALIGIPLVTIFLSVLVRLKILRFKFRLESALRRKQKY